MKDKKIEDKIRVYIKPKKFNKKMYFLIKILIL